MEHSSAMLERTRQRGAPLSGEGWWWWYRLGKVAMERSRDAWSRWIGVMVLGSLLAAVGCAGRPVRQPLAGSPAVEAVPEPAVVPVLVPPPSLAGAADLGPEVLLPEPGGQDREVARVGDVVLRESHVYERLLSAHPKLALDAVDLLVCDVLVAQHARQFGIVVPQERVDALVAEEEQALRRQIAEELGATMDLGTYVWRLFGMREDDWRTMLRLRTAQRLYQGYVIRYLALREDRVQVRFLVHKDKAQADEVVAKVQQGADFGTLALRLSEDDSRRDGGLLPPFARGSQHPVAAVAFTLQKGQVSAPFRGRWRDEERWFVVYCLEHLQGRSRPFAEVRDEIDRDLEDRAIGAFERTAYLLRWRGELEQAPAPRVAPDR